MNEIKPVIEETDIKLPKVCGGCGTTIDTKLFGFKTVAHSPQRQLIAYCQTCTLRITKAFIEAWKPDVSALHDPMLHAVEQAIQARPEKPMDWYDWDVKHGFSTD